MSDPLWFPDTGAALAAGNVVGFAWGARFEFVSQTMNVWRGFGNLVAGGVTWSGLGDLGDIARLELAVNATPTEAIELVLSGLTSTTVTEFQNQRAEFQNQRARLFLLTFDQNDQILDAPVCVRSARMDRARLEIDPENDEVRIRVYCEPLLLGGHLPPFSWMTQSDQLRRAPGDNIFERVALCAGVNTIVW